MSSTVQSTRSGKMSFLSSIPDITMSTTFKGLNLRLLSSTPDFIMCTTFKYESYFMGVINFHASNICVGKGLNMGPDKRYGKWQSEDEILSLASLSASTFASLLLEHCWRFSSCFSSHSYLLKSTFDELSTRGLWVGVTKWTVSRVEAFPCKVCFR